MLSSNRRRGHNFNVIDALDTSVFGILWHRWCIRIHWWGADTVIWLHLWLHRRCQAIGSHVIWSWMMWQCSGWSGRWQWRRNYWADRCIFTRLATVWWCGWCWGAHRFVAIAAVRFRRCRCIESKYILQWALLTKENQNFNFFFFFWLKINFLQCISSHKKKMLHKLKCRVHAGHNKIKICHFNTNLWATPSAKCFVLWRSCIIKMGKI